jgi:prepilin-type processing-associated H-X9-DG protein
MKKMMAKTRKGSAMSTRNREHLTPVRRRNPRMSGPRRARGGTIINILTAVVFFGLLALGILWIMKTAGEAGKQYTTAMINTQDKATALTCQMNLRSIAQSLQVYAISNEGFPDSQQELVTFCGSSKLFRCSDPNGAEYVYIPGQRGDMPATNVLVYEPKPVHNGRCNVLLLDGQIVSLRPEELNQAVQATQARRR